MVVVLVVLACIPIDCKKQDRNITCQWRAWCARCDWPEGLWCGVICCCCCCWIVGVAPLGASHVPWPEGRVRVINHPTHKMLLLSDTIKRSVSTKTSTLINSSTTYTTYTIYTIYTIYNNH